MVRLIAFLIVSGCFFILMRTYWIWYYQRSGRGGPAPPKRALTLFDVKALIQQGERDAAVEAYRQIFGAGRREAEKAVEELEKSMKE